MHTTENMGPDASTRAMNLLLDKTSFPQLPKEWEKIPEAAAWHDRVKELFKELKICNVEGFSEVVDRLKGKLKV